ncbi:MAG: hypothetical protein IT189_04950, partial [Microbacteriaceae bacterium]|nr:hypothetical protein [Microbacteriaceae bacterium]
LYLGTTSTVLAPFFILGPLIAGAVADGVGYRVVFGAAIVLAVIGVVFALRMAEPRRAPGVLEVASVGQPGVQP